MEFCDLGKQKPVSRGSEKILREEKEPQETKKLWSKKKGAGSKKMEGKQRRDERLEKGWER